MAITLKDLNLALEKQTEREKIQSTKETISMSELKELLGKSVKSEEQQESTLESVDSNQQVIVESESKKVKQAEQAANIDEDILDEIKNLVRLNKDVKETLIKGWTGKQSKEVFEKVKDQPEFRSMSERLGDWKRKAFSVRGVAQGVLGVKSGGMIDTLLAKREHKQQSIKDYMTATGVDKKTAESEYKQFTELQKQKRSVSSEYDRLKETYGEEAADKTAIGRKYRAVGKAMGSLGIFGLKKKEEETETTSTRKNVDDTTAAEQKQESQMIESQAVDLDNQQLDVQHKMLDALERIYKKIGGTEEGGLADAAMGVAGGSLLGKVGGIAKRGLSKVSGLARAGMGATRLGLGAIGTGTAATVAAGVGGALLAGYAGKKLREHVEKKEAANRAQEQEEISSNKIDVEGLKELPDDGKALSPSTINKVDRARNLMEQRVEAKQSFTEEEASLAKQKLGVVVPAELINKPSAEKPDEQAKEVTPIKEPSNLTEQASVSGAGISQTLAVKPSVTGAAPAGANRVYGMSAENAEASVVLQPASNTNNTVVAPTTVNNNTVNSYKPDVRNQDSSFRRMLDQRYVRV